MCSAGFATVLTFSLGLNIYCQCFAFDCMRSSASIGSLSTVDGPTINLSGIKNVLIMESAEVL